jgi:hypothetical protein
MNRRTGSVVAGVVLLVVILTGCGDGGGGTPPAAAGGTSFAAPVAGTDAYVGVVVNSDDRELLAYLCDGKELGTWFKGEAGPDGTFNLASDDGARLEGRIDDGDLTGAVSMPGGTGSYELRSTAVTAPAGLYRARGEVGGGPAVGGWIVLDDGSERGGIRTSTGFTSTDTDLARPPKPTTSFISTDVDF